jgi:hypothetical protein
MDEPIINTAALRSPRNRQMLIMLGVVVLAIVIALAVWQSTGTHGAKRDLAAANDKVAAKQKEVDDALGVYRQKVAELRALRADADAKATTLGTTVDQRVNGVIQDGQADVPAAGVTEVPGDAAAREYYVRDRHGRFVRVTPP